MLTSNFTQQSVFIVGEGSLLDDGVTQLLTTKTNSLVSRAIHSDEFSIKSNQSNVILICESGSMDVTHILDLIFSHPMTTILLIMIIRLRNNVIDVYARPAFVAGRMSDSPQRIVARTGDDLLNVLWQNSNVTAA